MKAIELTGQRFGRLTVGLRAPNVARGRHVAWHCQCECGNRTVATTVHLRSGHTRSCGCLMLDVSRARFLKHGHTIGHGAGGPVSPEYGAWCAIKRRCYDPSSDDYRDYGGRGITVCDRWLNNFQAFFDDMGSRPAGTSIDRIDNDRGYEPGNCRWATLIQQANNKRSNRIVEYAGQRTTISAVARWIGVPYMRLYSAHHRKGLPIAEAVVFALSRSRPGEQLERRRSSRGCSVHRRTGS